jgi:CHAT domain-containing protein
MSLWPVSDVITAEQMMTFYRLYGQGKSPADALRQAQLETISKLKEKSGYALPSLWAPFIIQGPPD